MPHASQSMRLFVENGRFEIDPTEPDADESPDIQPPLGEPVTGLIAVTNNAAAIHTGITKGNVHLDTCLFDIEPALDAGDWDEMIDTTFISTSGYARIGSYEHALDLNIAHQGPGTYRLRLHARGRDLGARREPTPQLRAHRALPVPHRRRPALGGRPAGADGQSSDTWYGETFIQPLPAAPLRVPLVVLARVYQEST
ncbi:hypothetical protein [Streptomyces atratus]